MQPPSARRGLWVSAVSALALGWGVIGLFVTLIEAMVRLLPLAIHPLKTGMSPLAWAAYLSFVAFNGYAEGYRGFQRAFSPRVAVRAALLVRELNWQRGLLAPLFLMGLVDATRRRLIANWTLVFGIICIVLLIRLAPQPWRGVVDAGVVVGLLWGTLSTLYFLMRAATGHLPEVDPEIAAAPDPTLSARAST
jgi:hypothetical protein